MADLLGSTGWASTHDPTSGGPSTCGVTTCDARLDRVPARPPPDALALWLVMGEWSISPSQPGDVRASGQRRAKGQRISGPSRCHSVLAGSLVALPVLCRTGGARGGANESACKPDPVPTACGGRRPSIWAHRHRVPRAVHPRTRASSPPRASPHVHPRSRTADGATFDLAPGGVYRATPVTRGAGALLPHRFTLTAPAWARRSVFCGTVPRVAPGCR